jgi:hypothetical protein
MPLLLFAAHQEGMLCADCSMTRTDLQFGLTCNGKTPQGGGDCSASAQCGNEKTGTCLKPAGSRPFCQCFAGYACSDCSQSIKALANGTATCH